MMVMQASSSSPIAHRPASFPHQNATIIQSGGCPDQSPKSIQRKQVQESAAYTFPSTSAASSPATRPQLVRAINRPREARPVVQKSSRSSEDDAKIQSGDDEYDGMEWCQEKEYGPHVLLWRASLDRSSPSEGSECSTLCIQTPPALVVDPAHRRTRSHFSIPDVVVTSCVEEGETLHYEMKVEPARRKMSLPLSLTVSSVNSSSGSGKSSKKQTPLQKTGQETTSTGKKDSRPKVKPIAIQVYQEMQIMDEYNQRSFFDISPPATMNNKDGKVIKRLRKSSLPSFFTRKDREATILPPSPTIPDNWQQKAGERSPVSPIISGSTPSSPMSSLFGSTPPTSVESAVSPISPTLPSPPSLAPSSPTSVRALTKREKQVKQKEEKNLIKDLEKIDKMVRKHDEKAQKAAKKAVEVCTEGKAKKVLRRMSVFRASTSARPQVIVTDVPSLPEKSEMERLMERQNHQVLFSSSKGNSNISVTPPRLQQRTSQDSDRNPNVWYGDVWTDLPSPIDEQLPSLTPSSPGGKSKVLEKEVTSPHSQRSSIQRNNSGSKRNSIRLEGSRRRTPTNSTELTTSKRRSFLLGKSMSPSLSLDPEDGVEAGWEDASDSPKREKVDVADSKTSSPALSTLATFSKPINLLESLYKDIEAMEIKFQLDRHSNSHDTQTSAVTKQKDINAKSHESSSSEPSSLASSSRTSTGSSSVDSVPGNHKARSGLNPIGFRFPSPPRDKPSIQRADTLPTSDLQRNEPLVTMIKSSSVPDFL